MTESFFETARLRARPFEHRDVGPFVAYRADPEVERYQDWSDFTAEHGYMWIDPEQMAGPVYRGMEAAGLATTDVDQVVDMSLLEEIAAE